MHTHGSITVTIAGERIDFSRDTYQLQDNYFHFEHGNGDRWHVHGKDVTLQYAMDTLNIHVTNETVTYQGTTYRDSNPGTTVTVEVNGEPVNPRTYVLQDGDRVQINVETTS